jgi:hypothetical protein
MLQFRRIHGLVQTYFKRFQLVFLPQQTTNKRCLRPTCDVCP